VFVNGDYIQDLLRRFPLLPAKRFVFIVHNSDRPFGQLELQTLLPKAKHIYAINTVVTHPQLTTIPLGFVDKQLAFLEGFKAGSSERDIEIYANFTMTTNPSARSDCFQAFNGDHRLVTRTALSVPEYYLDLCHSKFVLCPEGTGIDTHRVYEALFCGATPVVLHGPLDRLYERLPVCIVNSWTDPFTVPTGKRFSERVDDYI
jgi:hypothetical protein